jgi:voltage-gated potassium channel Kch
MLIGYTWTFVYALLDATQPGAFRPLDQPSPTGLNERVLELRYLSFMTLTTVGYGDVVPRSPTARTLCMLEALMGQIYLTVLVARLVGLHIVHAHTTSSRDD